VWVWGNGELVPKWFHAFESVAMRRVVEALMVEEHWIERLNGLRWVTGEFVKSG